MQLIWGLIFGLITASVYLPDGSGFFRWLGIGLVCALVIAAVLTILTRMLEIPLFVGAQLLIDYTDQKRTKRAPTVRRLLLFFGKTNALLGGRPESMIRVREALLHYDRVQGDWRGVASSASRLARLVEDPPQVEQAYSHLMRALVKQRNQEAFDLIMKKSLLDFEAMEERASEGRQVVKVVAQEDGDGSGEGEGREVSLPSPREIAGARRALPFYFQGLLELEGANLEAAREALHTSFAGNPISLQSSLLLTELAAWEGKEEEVVRWLSAAREALGQQRLQARARQAEMKRELGEAQAALTDKADDQLSAVIEELAAQMQRSLNAGAWQITFTEVKAGLWLKDAARMERVITDFNRERAENALGDQLLDTPTQRYQERLAVSLVAAVKKQGLDCEKPYGEATGIARWEAVEADAEAEGRLLRAVGQVHRGMPEAAIRKLREWLEGPAWWHPPFYEALACCYLAICYERWGRRSEGQPYLNRAVAILGDNSKLPVFKKAKKAMNK